MASIKIDKSGAVVVLVCADCDGVWTACAWTSEEAHDRAVAHEQRTHPDTHEAEKAREQWQRRHRRREAATRR